MCASLRATCRRQRIHRRVRVRCATHLREGSCMSKSTDPADPSGSIITAAHARARAMWRHVGQERPPYLPPADVQMALLRPAEGASFCEWKSEASYWTVLESIPGSYWRPAFIEKRMAIVAPPPSLAVRASACKPMPFGGLGACASKAPPHPPPSPACGRGSNVRPPSPACGRGSNVRPPLPHAGEGAMCGPSPARGRGAMCGPLPRVRERVGVRVVACPSRSCLS